MELKHLPLLNIDSIKIINNFLRANKLLFVYVAGNMLY